MIKFSALVGFSLIVATSSFAADFQWRFDVKMKVGESQVIAAARADCGSTDVPGWTRVSGRLPSSSLGAFSDGGIGTVNSNRCGGDTPSRGIVFTAERTGQETIEVLGETIKISVE